MAEFEVKVVRITQPVEHHPNADRLSIVKIGGYNCISGKNADGSHRYAEGELVVYVPEAAVVPEWALKHYGFWDETKDRGMLSGPNYDRVRAVKLRGVVSQGLLFKLEDGCNGAFDEVYYLRISDDVSMIVDEGEDVATILGITKYEPPIPTGLAGSVTRVPHPGTGNLDGDVIFKYDFENIQKVTDMFEEGEEVYLTEKLHGTFCQVGYIPGLNHAEGFGDWFVASKGLGRQGLCFQDLPENTSNLYVKTLKKLLANKNFIDAFMIATRDTENECIDPIWIFGEIFGGNVQDLDYGLKEPEFRIFDIRMISSGQEVFFTDLMLETFSEISGIPRVPVLAEGPYSQAFIEEHRDGKTTLDGNHMREGVVIRSVNERQHPKYGRKIAKAVSPDYLLRKNGTEYN